MASLVYNEFKHGTMQGEYDLDEGQADVRMLMAMTNTTADTENDGIVFVANFTTLDEHGTAGRKTLANQTCTKDDANDRAEFDADDVVYTALAAGARAVQGLLLYRFVSADSDSPVICWAEFATNKNPDGSDFTVTWDAQGIIHFT